MKKYLYLLILLLADSLTMAADTNDSLLNELDKAIEMRPTYIANKERAIRQLHRELKPQAVQINRNRWRFATDWPANMPHSIRIHPYSMPTCSIRRL
ncbi:hypothetical protein [Segatella baroniae]|uniref:hypothetical protein n=1 Tax=Segatella baroniae TaxID=305719 RepID=UPI001EE35FED|nr:hypothetical protein [Segatella baroniae]